MKRSIHTIYALIGIVVACGPAQLSSESSIENSGKKANADGTTVDVRIVKSEKTIVSESGGSDPTSSTSGVTLSFASTELSLNQGETKEIEVRVKSSKPNSTVTIAAPSVERLQFELLTPQGGTLTAPLALDSSGNGTFKLKVTSPFQTSAGVVRAPGALNANLSLSGSTDGGSFSGTLPIKVSNVAIYVMSGVSNVRDLPSRFEFPAGTIPVFANPSDRQVVGVMHFQGGSFRHQAVDRSMPMGSGYCPINSSTSATVPLAGPINPACQPCSATATADSTGTFYNHETENSGQSRTIVCKAKI